MCMNRFVVIPVMPQVGMRLVVSVMTRQELLWGIVLGILRAATPASTVIHAMALLLDEKNREHILVLIEPVTYC